MANDVIRPPEGEIAPAAPSERLLTRAEFHALKDVPPEDEWFEEITNRNTKRAYRQDVQEFIRFLGIQSRAELRDVQPAHIIAWKTVLLEKRYIPKGRGRTRQPDEDGNVKPRPYSHATIRRKLAAVSSLFDTLVEKQAISHNPTKGVKRPNAPSEKTPFLPDTLIGKLLNAPTGSSIKAKRDRAMLSTFVYHALREDELGRLCVRDYSIWDGLLQFKVWGKGNKTRYVEAGQLTQRLLNVYFDAAQHRDDLDGPLFRPLRNGGRRRETEHLSPTAIYRIVMTYAKEVGIFDQVRAFNVHSLRTTAANNARNHGAALDEVQAWMGHKDISTTRKHYVHIGYQPENSPTFKVDYNIKMHDA